jgi:hypothetical protein
MLFSIAEEIPPGFEKNYHQIKMTICGKTPGTLDI